MPPIHLAPVLRALSASVSRRSDRADRADRSSRADRAQPRPPAGPARSLLPLLLAAVAAPARPQDCPALGEAQITALFDTWNHALQSGEPDAVVALYAPHSILLPTVSDRPRLSAEEKRDYFAHFMERRPSGAIDSSWTDTGCDTAVHAGTYTFRFADGSQARARFTFSYRNVAGRWRITSHHSSRAPEPSGP